jgi:Raf kinase inhibitor-like YbhB/YbcL family protein
VELKKVEENGTMVLSNPGCTVSEGPVRVDMAKHAFVCLFGTILLLTLQNLEAKNGMKEVAAMNMRVTSSAFSQGGNIPSKFSCDGNDISPPITWSKGPDDTKSYALIVDDPDAPMGTWVHWVIYDIPPSITSLPENVPKTQETTGGSVQGLNDFKRHGYRGPCPPGGTHRYYFKVYALDTVLKAGAGLTKKKLLKEMEGHILGQGELMGTYSR